MRKTVLDPETGEWADHEVAYADSVAVDTPTHTRVFVSGMISTESGLEAQTRDVLRQIEEAVEAAGGAMTDVVRVRVYVARPHVNEGELEVIHDVRREFFVEGHYPASTLVEVERLVDEGALIEIDADAIVPDDEWMVEVE